MRPLTARHVLSRSELRRLPKNLFGKREPPLTRKAWGARWLAGSAGMDAGP